MTTLADQIPSSITLRTREPVAMVLAGFVNVAPQQDVLINLGKMAPETRIRVYAAIQNNIQTRALKIVAVNDDPEAGLALLDLPPEHAQNRITREDSCTIAWESRPASNGLASNRTSRVEGEELSAEPETLETDDEKTTGSSESEDDDEKDDGEKDDGEKDDGAKDSESQNDAPEDPATPNPPAPPVVEKSAKTPAPPPVTPSAPADQTPPPPPPSVDPLAGL